MEKLKLGYTPCPNDTFLFYHFPYFSSFNHLYIEPTLLDIEKLNQIAHKHYFDITKLSVANFFYPNIIQNYQLLQVGSTLGTNCGPILIKKKDRKIYNLEKNLIAIPGKLTTANLLLNFYTKSKFKQKIVRYDKILNLIKNNQVDLGVVIHEERFTLEKKTFEVVVDLGQWWEEKTKLPLPLGVIAIKRNIKKKIQNIVNENLTKSLTKAYKKDKDMYDFVLQHSQNKDKKVIEDHINLYINQFTKKLDEKGKKAIEILYEKSLESEMIQEDNKNLLFD